MDIPNRIIPCRATWAKDREVDWWEWTYDEGRKEYIMGDSDEAMPRTYIMAMAAQKQAEGWELCLAVI